MIHLEGKHLVIYDGMWLVIYQRQLFTCSQMEKKKACDSFFIKRKGSPGKMGQTWQTNYKK